MSPATSRRRTQHEQRESGAAAQRLADLVTRIEQDDLTIPTPCPAYTLGDLVDHVGGMALAFTGAARKDTGHSGDQAPAGDASRLPADWRDRIPRDLATLAQAWRQPAAWTGMTRVGGGDFPAETAGAALIDELVVHGWDVARATGQPYECETELLDAAQGFLAQFASPQAPAGPEVAFGPARLLPDDAPLLDRVVALAGRDPGWTAV
jgi:uncharacterized protein (TIGR03086 family)